MKRGTDDCGDPHVRVRGRQVAETFDLDLLHLRVGKNRLICSGLEHHFQFLQCRALETVNTKFDLSARDRFAFVRLDVGYQIPATAYQLTDTPNIVVDHILEQQHGRRFQCIRIGDAIILIGNHGCIPQRSLYWHDKCICFFSRVKFGTVLRRAD